MSNKFLPIRRLPSCCYLPTSYQSCPVSVQQSARTWFWRMLFYQVAVGALLLSRGGISCAEQLLRWKFTTGESLSYQFRQNTQTTTAGAGKPMRVAIDCTMPVTWKIESVDPQNVATIRQTIDRFSVTMTTDKLDPISYDSAAKTPTIGPAREIAEGVGKLIGATCQIYLTNRGEILSVEPSEQLKQAFGTTANPTAANPTAANQATGSMLTPDGMSRMLRQAAILLPENPLAEGAKWEAVQETPVAFGTILQRSQFTYAGVVDQGGTKLDKITVETALSMRPGADKSSTTKLKEGRQTGTLWFDSTAGRFVSSDLEQSLVTERPYREMTIRVQSTSTVTMKISK